MNKPVLLYHDVQLYDSDIVLFTMNQWLNDTAIHFYFQYIFHQYIENIIPERREKVLFMDPAVVSCMLLQCEDEEDYIDLINGLNLKSKELIFIPINNNQSFHDTSTHWSLLVYQVQNGFQYYDSSGIHNLQAAKHTQKIFLHLLSITKKQEQLEHKSIKTIHYDTSIDLSLQIINSPQQTNSYDCGMYVLLIAEYLYLNFCTNTNENNLENIVTTERIKYTRAKIPRIVQEILQSQQSS